MPSSIVGLSSDSEDGGCALPPSSTKQQTKEGVAKRGHAVESSATIDAKVPLPMKMYENAPVHGALARPEHDFCPYSAVAKYPYKYLNYKWAEMVSQAFFAGGQLQARGWTM